MLITKNQKEFIDVMLHGRNDELSGYQISNLTPLKDADTIIKILLSRSSINLLNGDFSDYFEPVV